MTPWAHQVRGVNGVLGKAQAGVKRICLTSPTGSGKSWMMRELALNFLERGLGVSLYTNRKILLDQITDDLVDDRITHGVRAAGHEPDLDHPFQVSSIQTEASRVLRRQRWELHHAGLVLIDEGHLHTRGQAAEIAQRHVDDGAVVVYVTATPVDMGGVCDELVVAGTVSECRACGALVAAHHFGPSEPDMRAFRAARRGQGRKMPADGEDFSEAANREVMAIPQIIGNVLEWFDHLNPGRRPTLVFAPGVEESVWIAQRFAEHGVRAAHIDGDCVWLDGEFHRSTPDMREHVFGLNKVGDVPVITNRWVMREGVDLPWLEVGLLALVAGSLQTYLQMVGRLLRASPKTGKTKATLIDFGGNWWRHGSANADREWHLELTAAAAFGVRADRIRNRVPSEPEPWRCPQCGAVNAKRRCACGYEFTGRRSRPVFAADGSVREMAGDIFHPRAICKKPNGPELWKRMYYRSRSGKGARTFKAAMALFAQENNFQWPDVTWPYMPTDELSFYRMVGDVPMEELRRESH